MQMVMVLTGLTGNEEIDRQRAEEYCRFAAHKGNIPLSPYLCFHGVFKDELSGVVEGFLVARLVKKVDEIWVFGFEQGEARKKREEAVRKRYGEKGRYFCHPEIGRELLLCAMYSEELIEHLEEMEV